MLWTLGSIISFLGFVVIGYFVLKRVLLLNKAYYEKLRVLPYQANTLILNKKHLKGYHKIYKNEMDSSVLIDKYLISHENNNSYIQCFLNSEIDHSNILEFRSYNDKNQLIGIKRIRYHQNVSFMPLIKLPNKTHDVNIDFFNDHKPEINYKEIYQKRLRDFISVAIIEAITFLLLIIPVGYLMLAILTKDELGIYSNPNTLLLGIILILSTVVLYYFAIMWWTINSCKYRGKINGKI